MLTCATFDEHGHHAHAQLALLRPYYDPGQCQAKISAVQIQFHFEVGLSVHLESRSAPFLAAWSRGSTCLEACDEVVVLSQLLL